MRDDPWTAANRDKEQQKVIIPPRRKPRAETASPPSKPTVSGPFWTGKTSAPEVPKPQRVVDARQRTGCQRSSAAKRQFSAQKSQPLTPTARQPAAAQCTQNAKISCAGMG